MNKLMMMMMGMPALMEEAGGEGGGGTPAIANTEGNEGTGEGAGEGAGEGEGAGAGEGEGDGEGATPAIANLNDAAGEGEGEGGGKPKDGEGVEETAEDIEKAITEGENDFKGKWDAEQVKAMAPLLKELGVSKESASKLAVKLAEIQTKQIQEAELKFRQGQVTRIKAANAENAKTFSKADYKQIDAGIKKFTSEGGALRKLLYTTELGTDKEVLKIFHALGAEGGVKETSAPAATGAAGNSDGWSAAFEK